MSDPDFMPRHNRLFNRGLACAIGAAVAAGAASAQTPQQTTATYEDWIVRCETQAGPPPVKICEMVQYTQVQGQGVISQVAVGRPVKGQPVKIVVQVPIGVWLPTGVKLAAGSPDAGTSAVFKRCLAAGCFADVEVKEDTIRKFRSMSEAGRLQFKDGNMKDVSLPVSFKGFGAAFDALQKE
jgi:invasion protein IalB